MDYDTSSGEEHVEQTPSQMSIDTSPGLLQSSPVLSIPVNKSVLQTLQQLFGPAVTEEESGEKNTAVGIIRKTSRPNI